MTVIFNIIFVSLLCFGLINNARKAEKADRQQEMKMSEYEPVRKIVDEITGKSYTFTMTDGGHYRHEGPRGSWSLQAQYFDSFGEQSLIDVCKQYDL